MTTKTRTPALGAEGWFTTDTEEPHLLGLRCTTCGTYVFPKADHGCPNPTCASNEFEEVQLSRTGTIWSYTDAQYQPPPPYVLPAAEHVPFCIAAVQLAHEGLVVMGAMVPGVTVDDLRVGQEVELVVDVLFADDETEHLVWKWKPRPTTDGGAA
jgi:uncharacterized OB-fold protein